MRKKVLKNLFIFSLALLAFFVVAPGAALAHNPHLVNDSGKTVKVETPEISQAFYGVLQGAPQFFEINSDKDFALYVNLLVPKLPDINKGLLFEIYKVQDGNQQLIAKLDGETFSWTEFYEPFGGDTYLKGPEFKAQEPKGDYLIKVSHCHADEPQTPQEQASCAFSKYILAIGEQESFPPKEILNTILLLPALKKNFFDRSPLTAYFNYTGLFLLGALIILAAAAILAGLLIKKARRKKRDNLKNYGPGQPDKS